MKRKIELLAPGGDIDSIKAAIIAGADAIYCGLDKFNARNRAVNITFENLNGILRLAHKHHCEVFLTLNIIILESEFPAIINLLNKLVNTQIDGVIVQDFGLFYLLSHYFPSLKVHASTQLTTHNEGQIKFLSKLAATRVNLSRELNLDEIKDLTQISHQNKVLTEVFVHGSNCISFSGICYMSSVNGGNSGNRGQCSQPCRDQYLKTAEGVDFPLNIKDNSAFSNLMELADAGVDSVKIEGRIKKYHYVYTVVNTWRKQLQRFEQQQLKQDNISCDGSDLRKVFNRDFSNSFLKGNISKVMFIDNPRDNSAIHYAEHLSTKDNTPVDENLAKAKRHLYDAKTIIIDDVKEKIEKLSIEKAPLILSFSGKSGTALNVLIVTPDMSFSIVSKSTLSLSASSKCLNYELLQTRFKALNDTQYTFEQVNLGKLEGKLIIPFKELTEIKKNILLRLNNAKEIFAPIDATIFKKLLQAKVLEPKTLEPKTPEPKEKPSLSLLISAKEDLSLCENSTADIYFELPNSFNNKCSEFVALFKDNHYLIPWFPSVLIGKEYHAAVDFLKQLKPKKIVTNNTGIAFEAYQQGIPWVAGPYLNIINSLSLLCLKNEFNCDGAFISNEINKQQIKRISKPDNFKLYYSIYHPIVLMTTRLCLFHPVTGCKKNVVDNSCIQKCKRSSSIINLKETTYLIDKTKSNFHVIYNEHNFLNTHIVGDLPDFISHYFIDMRDIKTNTKMEIDKFKMVALFGKYIAGNPELASELKKNIPASTYTQYTKGL